ncbi:MAG TPA: tetratricopeptide repeat protein [Pseudolabrys sp.]|jgi:tetratricopeptide (TPR) repeat protein|nr:tetratricopeptide repeat protein [Pseudolabrys sp.]
MLIGIARGFTVAVAGLWLAGCSTSTSLSDLFNSSTPTADTSAPQETADTSEPPRVVDQTPTGSVPAPYGAPVTTAKPGLLGSDPNDELSLGKKQYRANDFGLAEKHFRRAVETHPRDAEAWLGLAASYDRLRRFDLADRAYGQAIGIVGPTVAILNNQGYSYMLRGDYKRARAALAIAQRKDPTNKYVQNNLHLLEESYRKGKAVE